MQLSMVCLLVGVTMSALVYASALQQCMQSSKYGSHYGIAPLGYSYKSFVADLLVTCMLPRLSTRAVLSKFELQLGKQNL